MQLIKEEATRDEISLEVAEAVCELAALDAQGAGEQAVTIDDIRVEVQKIHHGKGSDNPVDSVWFYSDRGSGSQGRGDGSAQARKIEEREVRSKHCSLLPAEFCQWRLRVFCKRFKQRQAVAEAVDTWKRKKENLGLHEREEDTHIAFSQE